MVLGKADLSDMGAGAAAGGTGSVETFGVGRSALEAVAPDNFGGMSIEWTAEGGRWVVRSNSAPALFPNAAPPAKKVPIRRPAHKAPVMP